MAIYIIEHLEPRVWRWCVIEYKNISKIIGKENLWFTNIKRGSKILEKYGKVIKESVKILNLQNACVLDPEANQILTTKDAKKFDYFIFGGILGDYPPRKRTTSELTQFIKNAEARNIGRKQFSTDNAVFVTKEILNGKNFKDIKFKDKITIKINDIESTELPYLYPLLENNEPQISQELVKFIKRRKNY